MTNEVQWTPPVGDKVCPDAGVEESPTLDSTEGGSPEECIVVQGPKLPDHSEEDSSEAGVEQSVVETCAGQEKQVGK